MMQGAAVIEARGVSKGSDRQRGQLHRLWRVLAEESFALPWRTLCLRRHKIRVYLERELYSVVE